MYIINGNYGNHCIAVIQWAFEQKLENVSVVSIDTGWQAQDWQTRIAQGEAFAHHCGFKPIRLVSHPSFSQLMRDRKEFPSTKFQWCAGFLKGLPLIDWLDDQDPVCEGVILLGKRRLDSRLNANLAEFIPASEYYAERKIWYPLFQHTDEQFYALIKRAGFKMLHHRSLECDPCIHSGNADLLRLHRRDISKTATLEAEIGKTLFKAGAIEKLVEDARNKTDMNMCEEYKMIEMFDMGCGSPFGCGE